jgi:hypothetical protein
VAGRALAFADAEVIRLAGEEFVPVAGDDWYQRRRDDAEGAFFRAVADQGPQSGAGGASRQGIYCLTASGRLLAFKNHQDPDEVRGLLEQALRAWNRLPDAERRPGAVRVPDLARVDGRYARTPPEGGLILDVFTRILDRDGKKLVRGTCRVAGGEQAARDHLWLTRADCRDLIPARPREGDRFPMPPAVADRLVRYHLVDNTRGEPPSWEKAHVHRADLTWTVESVTDEVLRLRLEGRVLLANAADPARARRGFDAALAGSLRYDRVKKAIYRLEILAVGDHWGRGQFTGGERPGRQPLGIAVELTEGRGGADLVPPQGARDWDEYLRK